MNGVHDMGGLQCYGPMDLGDAETLFHAAWEKRVLGITVAMGATGVWNLDESRFSRESLPPAFYLSSSYYQIWLEALCGLLVKHGLVTLDELIGGQSITPPVAVPRTLAADAVPRVLAAGAPVTREATDAACFHVGQQVQVINEHPATHTRLPGYIRNKKGTIAAVQGCHILPDTHAHGLGEQPEWLYNVRFDSHVLWGEGGSSPSAPHDVHVDCWQRYLRST